MNKVASSESVQVPIPMTALDDSGVFCWNRIGVQGDSSCPRLREVVHCHNCPIFSDAGRMLFDRPPPDGLIEERTREVGRVEPREADDLQSALLFRLGTEWLLLDAVNIVEVAEPRVIRRIPRRTDAVFLGIVNIRGELRLAFDLRQLLGIAPVEGNSRGQSRFVVIHWERQAWVFPADEVSAVIRYGRGRESSPPSTLERWKSALVRSVVEWEGKKAGKIDPGELLDRLVKHVG